MSLQPTKTPEQIEAMRQGGQILAQLLVDLKNYVQPGMTGCQIDAWLEQEILKGCGDPSAHPRSPALRGGRFGWAHQD